MAEHWEKYSYSVDLESETTATKVLRLIGENKRVLELGSAVGSMTQLMKEINGCTIVAMELDPDMAKMAEPHCERMVIGNVENMDLDAAFGEDRFDVIVAADILEHLYDPWACLSKVRKFLKPEGYLVVSVPNIAHNALLAQLLSGRFPYQEKGLLDRTHLRFFTRSNLEDMLLSSGYLPARWERNLVAESATEFGSEWKNTPPRLQESLANNPDGQTYQFIVQAYPSTETGWVEKNRVDIKLEQLASQRKEEELVRTRSDFAEFQTAFDETSKAFNEARHSLDQQQKTIEELMEYHKAFHEARKMLEICQQKPFVSAFRQLWKSVKKVFQ
jgi:SAM-dependent methyltransferase